MNDLKWDDIIKITKRYTPKSPTYDTPAAIMYTSGTTGYPKGCIITHGNFVGSASSLINVYPFTEKDSLLSFLPLAHVFEEVIHFIAIHTKVKNCFLLRFNNKINRRSCNSQTNHILLHAFLNAFMMECKKIRQTSIFNQISI